MSLIFYKVPNNDDDVSTFFNEFQKFKHKTLCTIKRWS